MNRDDEILVATRQKDVGSLISIFFSKDLTLVMPNCKTETELWDYKIECPSLSAPSIEWAEISKDVLAFHNTGKGGVLFFGISDKDFQVAGSLNAKLFDSKLFNDKIRKYVGDKIWVEFIPYSNRDGSITIGVEIIPPLQEHSGIKRFQKNGPEKNKKLLFCESGSAIRKNDSSIVLTPTEANSFELERPTILYREYEIDEPHYRLLSADYHEFVLREKYCQQVEKGLHHSRSASVCLIGIGGVGKTALATWAVKTAYKNREFEYIVSISAKDRELTASGIQSIAQKLTSLNDLLDAIAEVLGFPEAKEYPPAEKRRSIYELLSGEKVLLFIDNLETAIDRDIIDFINNLPEPVKAIVTSRRNVITISSYPIEIGPLEGAEIVRYINSLSALPHMAYCKSLSEQEKEKIGQIYNGIPLAIKWILGRCKNSEEVIAHAETMELSGKSNEELLEFSFRRVFDEMTSVEKKIMQVLAVVSDIPIEALIQGTGMKAKSSDVIDSLEALVSDTIIIRYFDPEAKADKYRLLSLAQKFMLNKCIGAKDEQEINRRLSYWYNAEDVIDPSERQIVSAMRQGGQNMGNVLVSFAENAAKKGDTETAVKFFNAASSRDPQNWRVFWRYAEYCRHVEQSNSKAISLYETALKCAEKEKINSEIAIMHREFGHIYGRSGRPDALSRAIEHLQTANALMPHDPITAKYLADSCIRKGNNSLAISVLLPFKESKETKTRSTLLPLLLKAYQAQPTKYMLEIAELKKELQTIS
ncbi:MAG: putative DNA binding domain-containing protein [Anaerolineaceae bacterium]|nr:putative DNA binding domain-containing protein [Anaerolineaceae bacterium]